MTEIQAGITEARYVNPAEEELPTKKFHHLVREQSLKENNT